MAVCGSSSDLDMMLVRLEEEHKPMSLTLIAIGPHTCLSFVLLSVSSHRSYLDHKLLILWKDLLQSILDNLRVCNDFIHVSLRSRSNWILF